MNYELMKKAYEDFNGVWPYDVPDGMAVRNGEYANVPSEDVFNYREWNWVGTKADFNAYSESLRTDEINWDEAPEGATAYCDGAGYPWMITDDGEFYYYSTHFDEWTRYIKREMGQQYYSDAIKKPQNEPTAWQPKVGEECEYLSDDKWIKAFIAGKTKEGKFILERMNRDIEILSDVRFRSIKTEREKEIDSIKSIIDDWQSLGNNGSLLLATKLLDAGYRKTEEEK